MNRSAVVPILLSNFQHARLRSERIPLNFDTDMDIDYNSPISYLEFSRSLKTCKNSCPGPDNITYKMIDKSHISAKRFLLEVFNKIWNEHVYPSSWRMGTILSFLKPGKNPEDVGSYRPIALTSCLGKLMEKMINDRLICTLEYRGLLPEQQNGFRRMRSTADGLVRFTSDIMSAFHSKQMILCVSFDIEKVYDTTWRYNILKVLFDSDIKGNLPIFVQNFLWLRHFKTKIGNCLSELHVQQHGVPQGSVISCTLFSLAINGILNVVPAGIKSSLYVDDLLIYTAGLHQAGMERRMQLAVNRVNDWAQNHGFKFSTAKTESILFHRKKRFPPPPQLYINRHPIPSRSKIKYLGM